MRSRFFYRRVDMSLRSHFTRLVLVIFLPLLWASVAEAQRGLRGQIFLPNGAPLQKVTRFTINTDDGSRNEIFFTDSNGRITISSAPGGAYKITVESDGETYETTVASFDSRYSGSHISINLNSLKAKASSPPGEINVNDLDRNVSPKAKEAYDTALNFIKAQQYEQAVEPLKRAISLQKNYFQAHNDLGVVFMKLNKLSEAEETLRQTIKINDKVYLPQLNLGVVLNTQNKHKEAVEVLIKLQRRYPDLHSIHSPLIEALFNIQSWVEAEAEIQKALQVTGMDQIDLKIKLGIVEIRQGKFNAALTPLREAIQAEPDNALAQFNLGVALLQTGNLDEAETALLKTYQLKGSEMAGAQLMLGQVYFQKKNYEKAIEAFEGYLRDLPNAPNAAQVKEAVEKLRQSIKKP